MQARPAAPSSDRIILERRPNTYEPDQIVYISSEQLKTMPDHELMTLVSALGLTLAYNTTRDKAIDLVMRVATAAYDS